MTVNDLLDSEFCIGKAFVFFLVHAVKLHIEQHCFLTVFDCQNVTGCASALTTVQETRLLGLAASFDCGIPWIFY